MLGRTSVRMEQCSLRLGKRWLGAFVGVAAVLVVALLGAATGGSWALEERHFPEFHRSKKPVEMPTPAFGQPPSQQQSPPPQTEPSTPLDLSWLGWVLAGVAALGVAFFIWWLWRRFGHSGTTDAEDPRGGGVSMVSEEVMPDVPVLRQGVEAASRSLDEIPDPTNAIVAAWLELEEAAASSGVTRERAQTPTEFTVAVLERTEADPDSTQELLRLYHRARFSSGGVERADVEAAKDCLGRLAASWRTIDPGAAS